MGEEVSMSLKKIKSLIIFGVVGMVLCSGCNIKTSESTENTQEHTTQENTTQEQFTEQPTDDVSDSLVLQAERVSKDGAIHYSYFYKNDEITISDKRYMNSGWDNVEFNYACNDSECTHVNDYCTAIINDKTTEKPCSIHFNHNGKMIVFDTVDNKKRATMDSDNIFGREFYRTTDIYEVDTESLKWTKVGTFDGGIQTSTLSYVAVKLDNIVVFGGIKEITIGDKNGHDCTGAVYFVNLDDYSVQEYILNENTKYPYRLYNIYEYDGYVYVSTGCDFTTSEKEHTIHEKWYRIDLVNGTCDLVAEFNEEVWFLGAIGDVIYYTYYDNNIYCREIGKSSDEQLYMTVDMQEAIAFVHDDKVAVMTDCDNFGNAGAVEYTWYDVAGNKLETHKFDEWIIFLDVVGDRLIYLKPFSSENGWWIDKNKVSEINTSGTYIGDYRGWTMDKLGWD